MQSNGSKQTAPAPPDVLIARLLYFGRGCVADANATTSVVSASVVLRYIFGSSEFLDRRIKKMKRQKNLVYAAAEMTE
jgi:hypothetical protein